MAEVKKIATRESYGKALVELGAIDPRVVAIDADLAGSTKTGMFKKGISRQTFQLRHRGMQCHGNSGRHGCHGSDPLRIQLRHVRDRTCL